MGLLDDIENDATDSSVPVVDLLRKCKVLAARLKHQELANWASDELNGYANQETVPAYRRFKATNPIGDFVGSHGHQLRNAPIPLRNIPKKVRKTVSELSIMQPIAEVEAFSHQKGNLQHQWTGDVIGYVQHHAPIYENLTLMHAHSYIPSAFFKGIVDTVRTRLLDYVLAIQAENPKADIATPAGPAPISEARLHQTFNTTIVGGQANLGGQGPQSISGVVTENVGNVSVTSTKLDQKAKLLLQELQDGAAKLEGEDRREATAALVQVDKQLERSKPDLGRIKTYLDIAGILANLAPKAHALFEHQSRLLA